METKFGTAVIKGTERIINYNCDGLCVQEFCSNKPTRFAKAIIHSVPIIISLCEKHAEQFDDMEYVRGGDKNGTSN
jgi:hypothetical protein